VFNRFHFIWLVLNQLSSLFSSCHTGLVYDFINETVVKFPVESGVDIKDLFLV